MSVTPEILNEALSAYVCTFPSRKRLVEFISQRGLEDQQQEIFEDLDALLKTAEDHLWSYPKGVPWTQEFEFAYHKFLLERHAWMNPDSIGCILAFSRWLCWHEGLNAQSISCA